MEDRGPRTPTRPVGHATTFGRDLKEHTLKGPGQSTGGPTPVTGTSGGPFGRVRRLTGVSGRGGAVWTSFLSSPPVLRPIICLSFHVPVVRRRRTQKLTPSRRLERSTSAEVGTRTLSTGLGECKGKGRFTLSSHM